MSVGKFLSGGMLMNGLQKNKAQVVSHVLRASVLCGALTLMLSSASLIFCLGDWPRLSAVAGVVKVITLDVSESVVDALRGLARTGCEHWPDGFSHTLPELKYLKLSSVEENQNLKQNQNKR